MALNELQKKARSEYLEKYLEITECSQRKPYVFVSYASDNWETVFKDAIVPLQQTYGLRVYADKAFDKVNDKWIVPMLRNVRGADVVVVFVSQSYIESYACFLELLTAVNNKKQIVFISLEQELRLGDTTDQPDIERGVKNEILNQGANISTNTNNTSNDVMRAMKSAYTSLSTLLEQDALSKYDISDAFINFFRDASVNRKTINDLKAVKRTISSLSKEVFDKSLVSASEQKPVNTSHTAAPAFQPDSLQENTMQMTQTAAPADPSGASSGSGTYTSQSDSPVSQPDFSHGNASAIQQSAPDFRFDEPKKSSGKSKRTLIMIAAGIVIVILAVSLLGSGGKKQDAEEVVQNTEETDDAAAQKGEEKPQAEDNSAAGAEDTAAVDSASETQESAEAGNTASDTEADTETAAPTGLEMLEYESGAVYIGETKDGKADGYGFITYTTGQVYVGSFSEDQLSGYGFLSAPDGTFYYGTFKDGTYSGYGTYLFSDGSFYTGEWIGGSYKIGRAHV